MSNNNTNNPQNTIEGNDIHDDELCIAKLMVVDQNGNYVQAKRIELFVTNEGLLELGKELIKLSQNKDTLVHIRPSKKSCAVYSLGVYLHPESTELLILKYKFESLTDILNDASPQVPKA